MAKHNGHRVTVARSTSLPPPPGITEVDGAFVVLWPDPRPESFVMPSALFASMVNTINTQRRALAQAQVVVNATATALRSRTSDDRPAGQRVGGTPQGTGTPPA
jgi:hypothetical protein